MPRGAQPLLFHYMAKGTPLHAMDPRAKLALLLLVGIAIALAHRPWQFALVGAALACALAAARLPLRALLRQAPRSSSSRREPPCRCWDPRAPPGREPWRGAPSRAGCWPWWRCAPS